MTAEGFDAGARGPEEIRRAAAEPTETAHSVAAPTRGARWRSLVVAAAPRLGRGLVTAAITCLPVGVLAAIVTRQWDPLIALDNDLIRQATDVTRTSDGFRSALIAWQEAFVPQHVYLLAVPAVIWTWRSGLRARALWGLVTMLIGWNLGLQVKLIVERARPVYDDPVSSAPGFSFPSGHAFNAAMATCTVLVMLWPLLARQPSVVRAVAIGSGATFVVLTALDRVFLGVHFPSDVTAGILLAAGLVTASYAGFAHRPSPAHAPEPSPRPAPTA